MGEQLLPNWTAPSKLVYCMLASLAVVITVILLPSPVQAQMNNVCHINPFHDGRELYTEGTQGDMVYIVCVRLTYPYIRFETVMANDKLIINAETDQRETVASMTKREPYAIHNPIIAFNADYFGAGHGAEGLTVINGKRIDGPENGDCDHREFKDCRDNAIYRASLSISRLNTLEISHKGASEVTNQIAQLSRFYNSVGGGPILVREGEVIQNPCLVDSENVTAHNCSDTHQTAIGVSKDGRTMIIVVAESKTGEEMGNILVRYGANFGMKLDGGSSSQLWFNGKMIYPNPEEGREGALVANAILVFWEDIPRHDALIIYQSESPIAQPGQKVDLFFELQNRGFLTWEHELPYKIKFIGGDLLGLSEFYSLEEDVPLGSVLEWRQSIVAPQVPGAYVSIWQMIYEDSVENTEMIGPEVGFIVTVLPEGSSLNLSEVIRQIISEAKREAEETMEEFLLRVKEEINRRIEKEMRKIPCCEPFIGILVLSLASRKLKRQS